MTPKEVVQETQNAIDAFADSMVPIQRKLYNRVSKLLKDLSIDDEGRVKQTIENQNILSDIQAELQNIVYDPAYQKHVAGIKSSLDDIAQIQTVYMTKDFIEQAPKVLGSVQDQAFDQAVSQLTDSGVKQNVATKAGDIVSKGVNEGANWGDMNDQLRTFMLGDEETPGRLVSYSKQVVNDTLHGASRSYNSIISSRVDNQWFMYIGALVDTSRPICIVLEKKKWIHKSELAGIAHGNVNGEKVSTAGMMPGTTGENFINRCGGHNCSHILAPVPPEQVPSRIRRKFEDIEPDEEEKATSRPRRK